MVVIAIIGVLLALLMPAVQQIRESARRSECQNRLRQMSLALHNYHESHLVLPSGSIAIGPAFPTLSGWGWGAMILPYVDQAPLYGKLNFDIGTAVLENRNSISVQLPLWICPSDIQVRPMTVAIPGYPAAKIASGNYVGCEGFLSTLSSTRFSSISDGLSQTLFVGERVAIDGGGTGLQFTSSWSGVISERTTFINASSPHTLPIASNPINKSFGTPFIFSSRHYGGAHFAFGDSRVQYLSENMDAQVYQALGTPSGNESVSY